MLFLEVDADATVAVGCMYAEPNVLMLYLAVDAVATSTADCECAEPHVLMLYRVLCG